MSTQPPFNLGSLAGDPRLYELHLSRAAAIQQYAKLEQSLCMLFAHASDTSMKVAGVIFFKLNNARARRTIIETLLRMKHGDAHRAFIKPTLKSIGLLDERRNRVIHWHDQTNIALGEDGGADLTFGLAPPNYWAGSDSTLTAEDLREFGDECHFFSRAINLFYMFLIGHAAAEPWQGVFEKPLPYPPPEGHPLSEVPASAV